MHGLTDYITERSWVDTVTIYSIYGFAGLARTHLDK
jgi:hypothetical protein